MGVTLSQRCIKVIWVLGLFYGLSDSIGSASRQTSQLSAYEVTVPRRIGKQRRDLDGVTSGKVSYVIHAQGKDHVVVLEKNDLKAGRDGDLSFLGRDVLGLIRRGFRDTGLRDDVQRWPAGSGVLRTLLCTRGTLT
ncbi:hypothetical protein SKAU_G00007780 [Synaphobranchus kaupii]|uniref:Uncharacterized protein n=1 Tax=Synaphobranchus kaupii TaxID=118154 RepID=A0A9Q1G9F6_SYNKA|nr:hypothetical protein SKAU_G00007780 [Synaphobranchus kaupii]